jgi:hypothetical protein
MQIDLDKKFNLVDACAVIVKLSEKHLDNDSTNDLRSYFDKTIEMAEIFALEEEDDDHLEGLGRTRDLISNMILNIPKRIDRLVELDAPQVIIDTEMSALESLKKINSNLG